jgi:hypothetical protein
MRYGDEMVARHGEEYDWRSDVDVGALYSSGGGKKHGRFSMLNGVIDTSGALSEARCSQSSQNSRGYQRERENRLQEEIRQHRGNAEARGVGKATTRVHTKFFRSQIQVLCKFDIFSNSCVLFIAIRYSIYYRFLGNTSGYPWITI